MNFLDAAGLARFFSGLGQKFAALSHTHGTADIEDWSITTGKIANMAVTTSKLGNNCVTTYKLGNKCVTTYNLGDMSVEEDKLYPQAVTTAKIRDGAVTEDKLDAALKAKIDAGGSGSTVLYDCQQSPVALFIGGTTQITLDTALTSANPETVRVFYSTNSSGENMRAIDIVRTNNNWSAASYGVDSIWASPVDFGYPIGYGTAPHLHKIKVVAQSDYVGLSSLDSYSRHINTDYSSYAEADWTTPIHTGRIYIFQVVGG